jgi:ATP-binding cassette subfamily B protein RaxB
MSTPSAISLSFWRARRLPMLLQTESSECGLACLAMVASYWGHRIHLADIRRRFSVSLKGATLKSLIAMANALHLRTRPLKLGLDKLKDLATAR